MKNYPYNMTEFNSLVTMCVNAGWDFEVRDIWDGRQIVLYAKDNDPFSKNRRLLNDVVIHQGSYGHATGTLETWNSCGDVDGYLTAQQVFEIWEQNIENDDCYIDM